MVKTLIQTTERAATATVPLQRQQAAQQAQRLRQAVQALIGDLYNITTTDLAAVGASFVAVNDEGEALEGEAA